MRFGSDKRGNVAMVFALSLPVLAALGGFAVDYSMWVGQQSNIRAAADAAALAAARELSVATAQKNRVQAIAEAVVDANITVPKGFGGQHQTTSEILNGGEAIAVTVTQAKSSYFSGAIGVDPGTLSVRSVARLVSGGKVCVVGLDTQSNHTIRMRKGAKLTGDDCGVYANSTKPNAITIEKNAVVTAGLVCSAGGISLRGEIRPNPGTTDCPPLADPLSARPEPTVPGGCIKLPKLEKGVIPLMPGTYCNGLEISGSALVGLLPGIYVFKGPLKVSGNAEFYGVRTGLFFQGEDAYFDFKDNARIDLSAPTTGLMAGILFWQDPTPPGEVLCGLGGGEEELEECSDTGALRFRIGAERVRKIVGTVYLPKGSLYIDSKQPVADQSPWTAVVAHQLELQEGPHLVLNTNYGATDVPVPPGVARAKVNGKAYLEN